jgi:hypothetical protein
VSSNSPGRAQLSPYFLEVDAWTGAAVETLRVGTHSKTTEPFDTPPNTYYRGSLTTPGKIARSIFDDTATQGQSNVDFGFAELTNADGALDPWFNYGWGRRAVLKSLASAASPLSTAQIVLVCNVIGIETGDPRTLRLRFRGRVAELQIPLLSTRYAGTTVSSDAPDLAEGDVDLTGTVKPNVFGNTPNVQPKLVNKFFLLYQVAGNGCDSIQVYDGGIALTPAGNFGSLSALINATLAPGSFATCLAQGIFRLASEPAFMVTADVIEGANLSDRSAARVTQRMLQRIATILPADIDTASFDAFHAFNPAEVGSFVQDDSSAVDVIGRVANSVGGAVLDTAQGTFQATWLSTPNTTPDFDLGLRELIDGGSLQFAAGPSSDGQGVPAWSVVVKWGTIWQVQSSGELAPRIAQATDGADLARKQLLGVGTRLATAQDPSIKTGFPHAVELTFDTALTQQSAAVAEAARRLALYKVRRDRITFPTFFSAGNIELGKTVRITLKRFGYNSGKNFVVLGREDDHKTRRRTLTLWG